MEQKLFIQNRKNEKIAVIVDRTDDQRGLVFVMHGLGGFKEQPHILAIAQAFKEKGFTAIRFDTTNTLGESDGSYEKATITNYYEDLEDVVAWAAAQEWYQEPFVLAGHSLGGICTALFAERHTEKVLAIAPISTVVSGELLVEAEKKEYPDWFAEWERTGWSEDESRSKPGVIKRLPWSHIVDRLKYDLLPEAKKLTMPVLLVVGEEDTTTPPADVQTLYDALPGSKELHVILGARHTFRDEAHLKEIKELILVWIDKLPK